VIGRGYYDKLVRAAWDWRNGQLTLRWLFDSKAPGNNAYSGQGNHQMTVGDVDGDGKDEIINGSSCIDDDGTGLWSNRLGHADALHMSDLDPDRPGLEIWMPYESPASNGNVGAALLDARTGEIIWKRTVASGDIGRAMAADIDPNFRGHEMWAAGATGGVFDAKGNQITATRPSINFGVWWDADLSRELLDANRIDKWNPVTRTASAILTASGHTANNGTKATPALSGDILGDWREEVIWRTNDNTALHIYTTTIPAANRFYTLMHDPQYRLAIAWQNSAYNQPPHPGFYIGTDMTPPPTPSIEVIASHGIGDGHYLIKPQHSGLCLMADNGVAQQDCSNAPAQVWRVSKVGDFYELYSIASKKYAGVEQPVSGSPSK
jgi:rhamnogalacturonan endolyase